MILSDISVKRPVFAAVMSLLLVAFGIMSFQSLPVREFPDIEFPVVNVVTAYPGASAEVVESRITRLVEDQIAGIEGIKSISSTSQDGRSSVVIEFQSSRDLDNAANDVRERVSRVLGALPEEADPPEVFKVNSDDNAIIWYGLRSDVLDQLQLTDYAERNLEDRLSVVEGVAQLRMGSQKRYAMRIWIDRQALAARGLTITDIENALRTENVELPAGRLETGQRDFTVRMERGYLTEEDFRNLVIAQGEDDHLIRLGEVARVELGPREPRGISLVNGQSNLSIGVVKQSKANTLEVARGVKAEVERIKETLPPSLTLDISWDSSIFVEEAIKEVYRTLFIAVGLVILVIYLFLGSVRAALIPSVTVPVALLATFIPLQMMGYSINLLTLLALVLAIGLVVDDSIVVLENIYRRVEKGEPALLAAYRGARQVAFAVIATTLVLIGVFVPVIFLEGNVGKLFAELSVTLTGAVTVSSFVALSLSPMLCSKVLSRRAKRSWLTKKVESLFKRISVIYEAALQIALNNRVAVFMLLVASLLISGALLQRIPQEFTPQEDRGGFFMRMRAPEGASYQATLDEVLKVQEVMLEDVEDGPLRRTLVIAPGFGSASSFNNATGIGFMVPWEEREISTEEYLNSLRGRLRDITGLEVFASQFGGGGGGSRGSAVQVVVGGEDYDALARFRDVLESALRDYPGINNLDFDYRETRPQVEIEVDRDRAADLGVSVQLIGRTLETMLGGRRVTTFVDRGEEYDVILRAMDEDRAAIADIENMYVRSTQTNALIPLSNLVRMVERADAPSLRRFNRVRALTVSGGVAPGYNLGEVLDHVENTVRTELPMALSIDYKGESREFKDAGSSLLFAFLMALLVVYLVLSAQFESFIHPFVIMLTVPLAVAGAFVGLWLTGGTLNVYSQVGIIILIGLAAKNGILIVEFANQLRDAGRDVEEAVIEASCIRLRPVIMTGLSTAVGTMPLVLAAGAGSASRSSIGIVIVTGVIFATFFTLFVIPTFYRMFAPYTTSPGFVMHKLNQQQTEVGEETERRRPARPAPAE